MKEFVSRAGQKLEAAFDSFGIDVDDKTCADLGCSTGGFTDCLLQNGAKKVYSVDTGYGVLDWALRNDKRVIVMERTNALHVELPEEVDFISIDVSWTRQKLIIPKALSLLKPGGEIVTLIKPHYEADAKYLRGGKLLSERVQETIETVAKSLAEIAEVMTEPIESPVLGKKGGNTEYLLWLRKKK